MTCSIVLNESVDTTVEIGIIWRKGGETVSTGGRTSVSDTLSVGETSYMSTLTISPVDSTTDSGHYSCAVTVKPTPTSTFIVMATAEDTTTITVAGEFTRNLVMQGGGGGIMYTPIVTDAVVTLLCKVHRELAYRFSRERVCDANSLVVKRQTRLCPSIFILFGVHLQNAIA